jgi:hypothetical protein
MEQIIQWNKDISDMDVTASDVIRSAINRFYEITKRKWSALYPVLQNISDAADSPKKHNADGLDKTSTAAH